MALVYTLVLLAGAAVGAALALMATGHEWARTLEEQ